MVEQPRLVRACLGANLDELTAGELQPGANRVVSLAVGWSPPMVRSPPCRYHQQVSVHRQEREMLHYMRPRRQAFDPQHLYSADGRYSPSTSTNAAHGPWCR
ncbi:hypothetical protein [Stutzerimonas xanthomarina]|uniref:hypothetical protein n=1 Tax=Stutzerimonas xanthomarina TaxID=271420 RepID=UPI003AA8B474